MASNTSTSPHTSPNGGPQPLPTPALPVRFPIVRPPRPLSMPGLAFQAPLTHRGTGPGLIVVLPPRLSMHPHTKFGLRTPLDPEPVQKWAEEGFAVVGVRISGETDVNAAMSTALAALEESDVVDNRGRYAVLGESCLCNGNYGGNGEGETISPRYGDQGMC